MTGPRLLKEIVATTDVHSAFDDALPMLSQLHAARSSALIVDCGDFFEGTGYYQLSQGSIERGVLTSLYDVIAPGNHGWPHHFEPALHELTVCANAFDRTSGKPLFRRIHITDVGGRRVAVTAVIGLQAFQAIPYPQRAMHRVTNPAQALREVMLRHHRQVDSWDLLSHSGFGNDIELAAECPFLDVIFAGHCHSDQCGPVRIGSTLVVKGQELGAGYALAAPTPSDWTARTDRFPTRSSRITTELTPVYEEISAARQSLATPIGIVTEPYRNRLLDRRALLGEVALRLHTGIGAPAVILNETALRPARLGDVLTRGDLLAIEPFGNQVVHAHLPDRHQHSLNDVLTHVGEQAGPLVSAPRPLPHGVRDVLTTDYLAETYLGGRTHDVGLSLSQAVQHVLASPLPDPAEGAHT